MLITARPPSSVIRSRVLLLSKPASRWIVISSGSPERPNWAARNKTLTERTAAIRNCAGPNLVGMSSWSYQNSVMR